MTALAGKEVDVKFDKDAGEVFVDVSINGDVEVGVAYNKDVKGYVQLKASAGVKLNILDIASQIAAKTKTQFDDAAVNALKQLLGLKDAAEEVAVAEEPVV